MRQRLGAMLCFALGAVLIWSGLSTDATGAVGAIGCGTQTIGTPQFNCPTGVINFTEVTNAGTATPPGTWVITLTSLCKDPSTGSPVNQEIDVDNNTTQASKPVYVYSDSSGSTRCSYTYAETPVAPFTTTYAPDPPQMITFDGTQSGSHLDVTVTNTGPSPSSSSASSSSPAPSHSRTPTHSASSSPAHTSVAPSPSSSSAPVLASTGPTRSVRPSLFVGIALCLLGSVLLFAGRRPRTARRHG